MSDTIVNGKNRKGCTGCALCSAVCKVDAISMKENEEGFLYPEIAEQKCTNCGMCARKCPINVNSKINEATFYMGWHKDKEILCSSSSGGAFSAIAYYIMQKGGVVFGATKDNETKDVYHKLARTIDELSALRGSKYYQSDVESVYEEVHKNIIDGKYVLFSGTSCQIAALYSYLGDIDQEKLITLDVLCHGVANKKVIDEYITSQEKQYGKDIADFSFRIKEGKNGWQNGYGTRMQLFFADGTDKVMEAPYDAFFLGFNNNFFLRESCYQCKYCGTQRVADFTLGDFWGCPPERVSAEQRWNGVSLILVNSVKAQEILPDLKKDMEIIPIEASEAMPYNQALVRPQERPAYRDSFFEVMKKKGYQMSIQQKFPYRFMKFKFKNFLRKVLPKRILNKIMKNA